MKKLGLGVLAFAATIAGPAIAADMPVKAPAPVVYYDWSGAYVGFNAGGMWTDVNRHFIAPSGPNPVADFTTTSNDGIYGFHAGAQWQWGQWVLGVEAALTGCFRECRATSGILPFPLSPFFGEHKVTNLFTVGPRLGFAWDRWMIYGTGGYASAALKATYCLNGAAGLLCPAAGVTSNGQSRNDGWYAGGGFEYMVHKGALVDVILGAEYQHWDVSNSRAFCFTPTCNVNGDYDLGAKGDLVRARLTIKTQGYGWWGPM
jgi:outer membrane immunogenic protein